MYATANSPDPDSHKPVIDLRSDTVTRPCAGMMAAMQSAELGDDVYGEDPTVIDLQSTLAARTGHEAGLFFPSGVQSNLVALLTHCGRGDEYIAAQTAHTYKYEGGGAAALGGIQPQPLARGADGTLDLDKVTSYIKADDIHFARTRLLALENTTTDGMAVPAIYIDNAKSLCIQHGLMMHLDGARAFNAATALGVPINAVTAQFDSVSICLSKGLGAPVGSVLVGSGDFIKRARRWRKTVGGGMRQSGILAAAGLFALANNVDRLAQDHELAAHLAEGLATFGGIELIHGGAQTNMVFFTLKNRSDEEFSAYGQANGVLFGDRNPIRMVTHKDLSREDVNEALDRLSGFFR